MYFKEMYFSDINCSIDGMSWKMKAVVKTMGMDWQQL